MNRRTVNLILLVYLTIVWSAVIFRIDRFPITWVPMYSVFDGGEYISAKVWDKEKYRKGFLVTHRDGSTSYVSYKDLNAPKPNFRRLFYSRIFGTAPPKHKQGNTELGTLNRWVRGLEEDEPNFGVDWEWRMFWTLNKSLGHQPTDPAFIVRIEAEHQRQVYRKADLLRGDTSKVAIQTNKALIEWKDEWSTRWDHGTL